MHQSQSKVKFRFFFVCKHHHYTIIAGLGQLSISCVPMTLTNSQLLEICRPEEDYEEMDLTEYDEDTVIDDCEEVNRIFYLLS